MNIFNTLFFRTYLEMWDIASTCIRCNQMLRHTVREAVKNLLNTIILTCVLFTVRTILCLTDVIANLWWYRIVCKSIVMRVLW